MYACNVRWYMHACSYHPNCRRNEVHSICREESKAIQQLLSNRKNNNKNNTNLSRKMESHETKYRINYGKGNLKLLTTNEDKGNTHSVDNNLQKTVEGSKDIATNYYQF